MYKYSAYSWRGLKMKKERYILVENLIWKVLFMWKPMLIVAIVLALLVPSIKYAKDYRDMMLLIEIEESEDIEKTFEFTEEELETNKQYKEYLETLEEIEKYQENSIYLNINPLKATKKTYVYTISPVDSGEDVSEAVSQYMEYLTSGQLARDVIGEKYLNIKDNEIYVDYLQEFLDGYFVKKENTYKEKDSNDEYEFCVYVVAVEDFEISDIRLDLTNLDDKVKNKIEEYKVSEDTEITITLTGEYEDKVLASSFYQEAGLVQSVYDVYKNKKDLLETQMSEEQISVVQKEIEKEKSTNDNVQESEVEYQKPSFSKKYAVLGFGIGIIIICVIVFVKEMLEKNIQSVDEISEMYKIKTLGVIYTSSDLTGKNPIDKCLYALKNKKYEKYKDIDAVAELTAANIQVVCSNIEQKKVYVTGSEDYISLKESIVYKKIEEILLQESIELIEGENILNNAKAYMDMAEAGAVIFVEKVGVSSYSNVEEELTKANEANVKVIGVFVES